MNDSPLRNPIRMDDAVCYEANGGALIEPAARPIRWLPLSFLGAMTALVSVLWLLSLLALLGEWRVVSLIVNLVRLVVVTGLLGLLGLSIFPQWRSVRMPVVFVNPQTEIVELLRARSIRRVPFAVITDVRAAPYPAANLPQRVENAVLQRLRFERYGLGLWLQHGECVWCGLVTGDDARSRADAIVARFNLVMHAGQRRGGVE